MHTKYLFFSILLLFTACRKPQDGETITFDTDLCITLKHHEDTVADLEIYVKFGQATFPGYNELEYDTSFVANVDGRGCIENLPYGQYWLMTKGPDLDWGADVFGSIFLELSRFQTEIDTVLVVNEI